MMNLYNLREPALLQKNHEIHNFDCGTDRLNDYLKKYAFRNQQNYGSRTYVIAHEKVVLGYFSLAFGSVDYEQAPLHVKQGIGKYPIPVLILARLAVDKSVQGKGLGKRLLKDALLKATQAAAIAGLRAVVVHTRDDEAAAFYRHFGFKPSPLESFHLFLLIRNVQINNAKISELVE